MFQEFSQAPPGTCEERTTEPNTRLSLYATEDTIHNNPVISCLTIIHVVDIMLFRNKNCTIQETFITTYLNLCTHIKKT